MEYLIKYLFLVSILHFSEGHYEGSYQACAVTKMYQTNWSLDLNENKSFIFRTIKSTNEYLSKPRTSSLLGRWEVLEDTVKLYLLNETRPVIFFKKDDELIFQNNTIELLNRNLLYLNKLKRTSN